MYEFDGRKFWCFGGASSHDIEDGILNPDDYQSTRELIAAYNQWSKHGKRFRVNHLSWWEQELPSQEEMDFGIGVLKQSDFKTDYIITHCCPQDVASMLGFRESDSITSYFNEIARQTEFTRWYFGHYHGEQAVFGKFILLYDRIERIL